MNPTISQKRKIVKQVAQIVKAKQSGEGSGHDWWHTYRVWQMAKYLNGKEKADFFVVELGALLHDIADWKFHSGDDTAGPKAAKKILNKIKVSKETTEKICEIITHTSYKGAGVKTAMDTLEGKIVQDADRLDAIGAVGIARAFAFGGHAKRAIYDPANKPRLHKTAKQYKKTQSGTSINHFYEKLLLLKDRMNTKTGKKIAVERHKFMEQYLTRFYQEWEGKI